MGQFLGYFETINSIYLFRLEVIILKISIHASALIFFNLTRVFYRVKWHFSAYSKPTKWAMKPKTKSKVRMPISYLGIIFPDYPS